MSRKDEVAPCWGPLEIGAGGLGRQAAGVLLAAVVGVIAGTAGSHDFRLLSVCVAAGLYLMQLALSCGRILMRRAKGPLVLLDDFGITVVGERTVAWEELIEVRVSKRRVEGVAFVPRFGTEVPSAPMRPLLSGRRTWAAQMSKAYGSPLVLVPASLDVSTNQILAAVHRFGGGLPVRDRQGRPVTV